MPNGNMHRIIRDIFGQLKSRNSTLETLQIKPDVLYALLRMIESGEISSLRGKDILEMILDGTESSPLDIAKTNGWFLQQGEESGIRNKCQALLDSRPDLVIL
jgi:Asp-tRNA(Asn)/Glu-tRNA(Gln) amidotransferase B subunit